MGLTTSLFVCCLTCSSVAVKVFHRRSHAPLAGGRFEGEIPNSRSSGVGFAAVTKKYFTPELETELANTGSGRTMCPICCEKFGEDGNLDLAVLECVHAYHFSCLESYALNRPNSTSSPLLCPVCQQLAVSR